MEAPEPAEAPELYGDAQWMRVFKTQFPREVTLDELMADNPLVVPMGPAQLESNWEVIQAEPVNINGNHRRSRKRNQGNLDPTTRSVVRRIEMYTYTNVLGEVRVRHDGHLDRHTAGGPVVPRLGRRVLGDGADLHARDHQRHIRAGKLQ